MNAPLSDAPAESIDLLATQPIDLSEMRQLLAD